MRSRIAWVAHEQQSDPALRQAERAAVGDAATGDTVPEFLIAAFGEIALWINRLGCRTTGVPSSKRPTTMAPTSLVGSFNSFASAR